MGDEGETEPEFHPDQISALVGEVVETTVGEANFAKDKTGPWTNRITEQCLVELSKLKKPFKYIVTCVIMQRVGAGLHMASTCLWNRKTDGSCHVRWENGTVVCVVTVFGLAI